MMPSERFCWCFSMLATSTGAIDLFYSFCACWRFAVVQLLCWWDSSACSCCFKPSKRSVRGLQSLSVRARNGRQKRTSSCRTQRWCVVTCITRFKSWRWVALRLDNFLRYAVRVFRRDEASWFVLDSADVDCHNKSTALITINFASTMTCLPKNSGRASMRQANCIGWNHYSENFSHWVFRSQGF